MYHTKSEHWQNEEFSAVRENVREDEKVDEEGYKKGIHTLGRMKNYLLSLKE